jgi:hypothetical protein
MTNNDLLQRYNYDAFIPDNFGPWMRFDESPPIAQKGPTFPLWRLDDRSETSLEAIWAENKFTIVEFGSFT